MSSPLDPGRLAAAARAAGLGEAAVCLQRLTEGSPLVCAGPQADWAAASMIKVPLAVAAAVAVGRGTLEWGHAYVVEEANMTPNDAPSPLVPGAAATLDDLVSLAVSRSDNVATNMLIDVLGRERATADLAALGYPGTMFRRKLSGAEPLIADPGATGRNAHPPAEAARLFAALAAGAVAGAARVRAALRAQYWNGKLSLGLEPGDVFEHKTGDTETVSHDGGILTLASGESWTLVVYTHETSGDADDPRFAEFMRTLRPLFSS